MKSLPLRKWNCPDVWVNLVTRRLGMPQICAQRLIGVGGTLAWILHSRRSTTPLPLRQARWEIVGVRFRLDPSMFSTAIHIHTYTVIPLRHGYSYLEQAIRYAYTTPVHIEGKSDLA